MLRRAAKVDGPYETGWRQFLERQRSRLRRVRVPDRFGPGYRVYFGKDGERLVILLGGGTKKRQQHDINVAVANWQHYKRRK